MQDRFRELAKARIKDKRNIVISSIGKDSFTIAQQLVVEEEGIRTSVFLKGAIHVDGIESLYGFRDAINEAIKKYENF